MHNLVGIKKLTLMRGLRIMPKRILIAEDDVETNRLLTLIATRDGYEVVSVSDGVELLAIAANEKFDLIITDLRMPNLNGASAVEIIKMQDNSTPVIALTASNYNELDLVRDKFTKIFYKPCDVKELFEYVESLLGK
jgi:CheY-like chemotaxis protein